MRKIKLINFLQEEKKEEKCFKCTLIILIYLLVFQCYINITSVKNLKNEIEEINNSKKLIQSTNLVNNEKSKCTTVKDINKIYDLLGFKNVDRLLLENNKVEIEGKCKSLNILEELKSMDNVDKFSITNVEQKNNKFYFHATYEIGGNK